MGGLSRRRPWKTRRAMMVDKMASDVRRSWSPCEGMSSTTANTQQDMTRKQLEATVFMGT